MMISKIREWWKNVEIEWMFNWYPQLKHYRLFNMKIGKFQQKIRTTERIHSFADTWRDHVSVSLSTKIFHFSRYDLKSHPYSGFELFVLGIEIKVLSKRHLERYIK